MRKKARNLGLTNLMSADPIAKEAVNMAMALPLLPTEMIGTGLNVIKVYIYHNGLGADLAQIFNYVQSTWIEGIGFYKQFKMTNSLIIQINVNDPHDFVTILNFLYITFFKCKILRFKIFKDIYVSNLLYTLAKHNYTFHT